MRVLAVSLALIAGLIAWIMLPAETAYSRINGASIVNPPRPIESTTMAEVKRINAEWIAAIPIAFSRMNDTRVSFDHSRQWWGEHSKGNSILVQYAKENGLKVMVKPHVWSSDGWIGEYDLASEEEWKEWEKNYTKFILTHARKADSLGVELFCVGTEYKIPAKERPEFWRSLISQVRGVYKGEITYASNWDNYENITWWDQVDYIGIDAYFPLVDGDSPTTDEIIKGWEPVKKKLAAFSRNWNKRILFTEYGFQSANGAAGAHWEVDQSEENANNDIQANAYEATFRTFENESWYAGGFFWKWHFTSRYGRWRGTEWTPQNKPAEQVIARWYGKNN